MAQKGLSSASNLSPLAPPFTINRPSHQPCSTISLECDSTNPPLTDYGSYFDGSMSSNTHAPSFNTIPDAVAGHQLIETSNSIVKSKPYYPQYLSAFDLSDPSSLEDEPYIQELSLLGCSDLMDGYLQDSCSSNDENGDGGSLVINGLHMQGVSVVNDSRTCENSANPTRKFTTVLGRNVQMLSAKTKPVNRHSSNYRPNFVGEGDKRKDKIVVESCSTKNVGLANSKSISGVGVNYSPKPKSEPTVSTPSLHAATLRLDCSDSAVCIEDSSSDLDSPCWKGKLIPSLNSLPEREVESCKSLTERESGSYKQLPERELETCKRLSLNPHAPQFFPYSSENNISYCPNGHFGPRKEECFPFKGKLLNQESPKDATTIARHNESVCASFNSVGHNSNSDGLTVTEICLDASKSFLVLPKVDVHATINELTKLSELLKETYLNDSNSVKEHQLDALKCVINNLCVCTGRNIAQSTSMHEGSSSCLTKKLGHPHKDYFSRSGIAGVKDAEMTEIIGTVLKRSHGLEENLDPQALLYKNLWLEAEAALCTMKYQASAVCMKTGMVDYK